MIFTMNQEKAKTQGSSIYQEEENLIQTLMQEKKKLQDENAELQGEVSLLETKLESMNKSLRMLNNGKNALDVILEASKKGRSMKGIRFDYSSTNQEGQVPKNNFVVSEGKTEFIKQVDYQMSSRKSQHIAQHGHTPVRSIKNVTWRCQFSGRYGHLRPYCYRLYGYPRI